MASHDRARAHEALRINTTLLAAELADLGIDVDCVPLLDLHFLGAHDVIGDRAFGGDPDLVADLGRIVCETMLEGGVMPVAKHIPGHGRARVDSHHELPVVDTSAAELEASDFRPFQALADAPWGMTAHVIYTALDAEAPATTSRKVIDNVIRGWIGFDGLLLSDGLARRRLRHRPALQRQGRGDGAGRRRRRAADGAGPAPHRRRPRPPGQARARRPGGLAAPSRRPHE